jgi:hypothetical protein
MSRMQTRARYLPLFLTSLVCPEKIQSALYASIIAIFPSSKQRAGDCFLHHPSILWEALNQTRPGVGAELTKGILYGSSEKVVVLWEEDEDGGGQDGNFEVVVCGRINAKTSTIWRSSAVGDQSDFFLVSA